MTTNGYRNAGKGVSKALDKIDYRLDTDIPYQLRELVEDEITDDYFGVEFALAFYQMDKAEKEASSWAYSRGTHAGSEAVERKISSLVGQSFRPLEQAFLLYVMLTMKEKIEQVGAEGQALELRKELTDQIEQKSEEISKGIIA